MAVYQLRKLFTGYERLFTYLKTGEALYILLTFLAETNEMNEMKIY